MIARDTGDDEQDVEFWGCPDSDERWVGNHSDAIVYFDQEEAETIAMELGVTCCVVVDFGLKAQSIVKSYYEEKEDEELYLTKGILPAMEVARGLEPLRELFQCYQDAKESIEATGATEWWLNKFAEAVDKLLE